VTHPHDLEQEIEAELKAGSGDAGTARRLLGELYESYRDQRRLLDRLVRISDQFQRAERDRGQAFAADYRREVRRIEKLVRISDSYQTMLHDLNHRLLTLSTRDDLTGLLNRRSLRERVLAEMTAANRGDSGFALAFADIDHFKAINDTWGHQTGDAVLISLASTVISHLGDDRACGRWGGEEFLILFAGYDGERAVAAANHLREVVGSIRHAGGPDGFSATISLGVTLYQPGETLDMVLSRADAALYQAKETGRNRVVYLP